MGISYAASDRVARIVLDRPDAGNALDLDATRELCARVRDALEDPYVDVLVLTAAGSDFCVGSDTAAAETAADPTASVFELAATLDELFTVLDGSTKPVLVGVQGLAAGSGLGLALAADLVLCTPDASFRVAPTGGTGAPDTGLAWLLPRAVGRQRALSFALSRRTLDARTAEDWGITTIAEGDLDEALTDAAEQLAGDNRWATAELRRLLRSSWETSRADLAQSEAATLVRALLTRSRA